MNITLKNSDLVNATINVEIVKSDYTEKVENALKDLRKNAAIPGFRKGMVPKSIITQRYGISVLVEEINKLVSNGLYDYIRNNNLNVLGEPLPNETEQKPLDFGKQEDFEFIFDIGLSPEINVNLTKDDKLTYYAIKVEDEMLNKQIESYKSNYGTYADDANTVEEKDVIKGVLTGLDENGNPAEAGITVEDAVLMPSYIKTDAEKAKFIGAALNATVVFNPFTAYEGNEAELASFLKIKKEEVNNYTGDFAFEIKEITRYKEAELNQELFDKVFEPGTVTSEEAFRGKVKENISSQLTPESDYKFLIDIREYLNKKAADIQFPDAFLKRWLLASNTSKTPESVEENYASIIEDLKFQLIKNRLVKENGLEITDDDVKEYAKQATRAQFAQYGMANVPDQLLENYSQEMLKKEETVRNLIDKALEDKLIKILKTQVTLKTKKVTVEDFQKLFEKK
jgi:trigger factor